jgi:nucleoside-diphosphate-sugar epimerase
MKVFVTGHRGYIGSHLVELLKEAGHEVTGCDLGLFDGCAWEPVVAPDRELIQDVRTLEARDLDGHDAVMHLAAISNDPMGDLDPAITFGINRDASVRIAKLAKQAGVGRYLFAGSCSVYGQADKPDLAEDDALNPLTAYAKSKIETEEAVRPLADDGFTPVFLRNSTAYGHSPMLRIDLVVNNLLACAHATGEVRIMSDGSPWRPLIHCRDIARAFVALAEAPKELVSGRAINIGANSENVQVKDVGDLVRELVPNADVVFTGEVGADPRSYKVNFDLLYQLLPDFRLQYSLATGMEELNRKLVEHRFSLADFQGSQFVRLRTLQGRLDRLGIAAPALAA